MKVNKMLQAKIICMVPRVLGFLQVLKVIFSVQQPEVLK